MTKSNIDICTNPLGVPVLGQVMLDPLRSRSLFAPFSTTRLSIKNVLPCVLTSSSFSSGRQILKNLKREKMKGFIGGFIGFECKEG